MHAWGRGAIVSAVLAGLPSAAGAACTVARIVDLPVTMADGYKPLVAAEINGVQGQFIADSGAFYSLISPGMAKAAGLHLRATPPGFRLSGMGGTAESAVATVNQLRVAGIPFPKLDFLVGGSDTGTAGLLGQNVLGAWDVEYDFPHGMVRLFRSRDCGSKAMAYWVTNGIFFDMKIDLMSVTRHTIGSVTVNGKKLRAMFDTGASRTALTREAAARAGVTIDTPGVAPAGPSRGLGQKIVRAWSAPFDSIEIGGEQLRNVRLGIIDTELGHADMLIGADFFISHRVYVDNAAHRLFFTYEGGRIFGVPARIEGQSTAAPPAAAVEAAEPSDAGGYSRRGAVFLAQRDYTRAIGDFGKAIDLAPGEAKYLLQRSEAYARSGRRSLAAADLNRAVEVDPGNVAARIERAQMRLSIAEHGAALADVDAAAKAAVGPMNERLPIASLYTALGAYDRAVGQFDLWIAAHPEDSALPSALNGRCWARALWGKELDRALSDCNAALRRRPKTPAYLDSRGIVRLRMGDYDHAIEDFDAALAGNPGLPWSLYGRGLARRHKSLGAAAAADLKAAADRQPDIAERARKAGIE